MTAAHRPGPVRSLPARPPAPRMQPAATPADPWLDVRQVAAALAVSKMTVYRLIDDGELRHVRIGRLIRVRGSWVGEFVRTHTSGGGAA